MVYLNENITQILTKPLCEYGDNLLILARLLVYPEIHRLVNTSIEAREISIPLYEAMNTKQQTKNLTTLRFALEIIELIPLFVNIPKSGSRIISFLTRSQVCATR